MFYESPKYSPPPLIVQGSTITDGIHKFVCVFLGLVFLITFFFSGYFVFTTNEARDRLNFFIDINPDKDWLILDEDGNIPEDVIPISNTTSLFMKQLNTFQWDANSNTPALNGSTCDLGLFYIVSVAGFTSLGTFGGFTDPWFIGDGLVCTNCGWFRIRSESYLMKENRGQPGFQVPLGLDGKISTIYFNNITLSGMQFKGIWDAQFNIPSLQNGIGNNGDTYIVGVTGDVPLGGFTNWKEGTLVIFDQNILNWIPLGGGIAPPLNIVLGQGRTTSFDIFFQAAQGGGASLKQPIGGPVTYRLPNVDGRGDHSDVLTMNRINSGTTAVQFNEVDTICEVYQPPRDLVKIFPLSAVSNFSRWFESGGTKPAGVWTEIRPFQYGNTRLAGFVPGTLSNQEFLTRNRLIFGDIDIILERCPVKRGQTIATLGGTEPKLNPIIWYRKSGNSGRPEILRVIHFTAHFKLTVPRLFVNSLGNINDDQWLELMNGFMIGFEVDTRERPKFSFTEKVTFPFSSNTFGFDANRPYIERATSVGVTGHCTSGTYNNLAEDADDILRSQGNGDGLICGQYFNGRIWCSIPQYAGSGVPFSYLGGDYHCYLTGMFLILQR